MVFNEMLVLYLKHQSCYNIIYLRNSALEAGLNILLWIELYITIYIKVRSQNEYGNLIPIQKYLLKRNTCQ